MTRRIGSRVALALGSFSLLAALAPAPQAPRQGGGLTELAGARVKVCERMVDFYREAQKAPPKPNIAEPQEQYAAGYEPIEVWSRRLADARLDATIDHDERVAILAAEVERIKKFSGDVDDVARDNPTWKVVADQVAFYRLDAEYRLAKEKAGK